MRSDCSRARQAPGSRGQNRHQPPRVDGRPTHRTAAPVAGRTRDLQARSLATRSYRWLPGGAEWSQPRARCAAAAPEPEQPAPPSPRLAGIRMGVQWIYLGAGVWAAQAVTSTATLASSTVPGTPWICPSATTYSDPSAAGHRARRRHHGTNRPAGCAHSTSQRWGSGVEQGFVQRALSARSTAGDCTPSAQPVVATATAYSQHKPRACTGRSPARNCSGAMEAQRRGGEEVHHPGHRRCWNCCPATQALSDSHWFRNHPRGREESSGAEVSSGPCLGSRVLQVRWEAVISYSPGAATVISAAWRSPARQQRLAPPLRTLGTPLTWPEARTAR